MALFVLTLHVRKTGKCHRGAWKAGWQFPDVTRPELKLRGMPIFVLTLHVRKTGKCHRRAWKAKVRVEIAIWAAGIAEYHILCDICKI